MAMLTIRNLEDELKSKLRLQAAEHGHSMEEEVRQILRKALSNDYPQRGLGSQIQRRVRELGVDYNAEITLPERTASRPPPDFSQD